MHRLIRTSLALTLGIVALTASTGMPVQAAERQHALPVAHQALFKPDLRLTRDIFTDTSTVTTWNWTIENIGVADSGPITVQATCHGYAIVGTKLVVSKVIPGLRSGQRTSLSYKCAGGLKSWVGTNVTVRTQDDLDLSNNTADWDND
jgi:hypothetical protein